jgi:hypothetical protein
MFYTQHASEDYGLLMCCTVAESSEDGNPMAYISLCICAHTYMNMNLKKKNINSLKFRFIEKTCWAFINCTYISKKEDQKQREDKFESKDTLTWFEHIIASPSVLQRTRSSRALVFEQNLILRNQNHHQPYINYTWHGW